jgi:hypothetical protein
MRPISRPPRPRDTRRARPQGLLLGFLAVVLAAGGCAHTLDERAVDVDFLWVRTEDGKATDEGGTTRARVVLTPNPSGDIRVGVLENAPGSIGEMWRAAVWLAAVMSAMETGQSLGDARLTVEADGFIDGPSAGSLMTAAMIAARSGDEVRSDVTMTGTVNPDGSIGPVGGLPQKVRAAIRGGKKRIGLPIGQGRSLDPVTGQMVNLVHLARSLGAEAIEIDDVNAAYALLTGRRLNRPAALEIRDMELPRGLRANLRGRAEAWLTHAQRASAVRGDAPAGDGTLQGMWQRVAERYEESQRYLERGEVAAAYWHAADTAIQADVAATLTRFAALASRQDAQTALNSLSRLPGNVDQSFRALASRLRRRHPRTVSETIQSIDALEAAIASAVHIARSATEYRQALGKARGILTAAGGRPGERLAASVAELHAPVLSLIVADANLQIAVDTLSFELPDRHTVEVTAQQREQLADLFTRAAQANLHYFDTTYLDQQARERGISRELAVAQFAASDHLYFTARAHLKLTDAETFGAGTETQKLARLAGGLASFFGSASIIARYESFQITRDASGEPSSVGRERVFWRMLALAERKAREHAARVKGELGHVPAPALIAYQIGRVYQERPSLADKLQALEQFWRASMWCQLANHLAQ